MGLSANAVGQPIVSSWLPVQSKLQGELHHWWTGLASAQFRHTAAEHWRDLWFQTQLAGSSDLLQLVTYEFDRRSRRFDIPLIAPLACTSVAI